MRSQLASSTAPNGVPLPCARAMAPSSRSNSTNAVTAIVPANSWPLGKNQRVAATEPMVPSTVMEFGVSPRRTSHAPMGSVTRETEARAKMFSMGLRLHLPAGTMCPRQRNRPAQPSWRWSLEILASSASSWSPRAANRSSLANSATYSRTSCGSVMVAFPVSTLTVTTRSS